MDNRLEYKIKLLIVDDEEETCGYIKAHFQRRGFIVLTAGSGEEALDLIKEQAPDIMLLDINLPKMSGLELLKTVREFNQVSKAILVSAYEMDFANDPNVMSLNIFDVMRKPVTFDVLDEAVKKAIG
jgi:YesN/AraC family two-component response regulator